MLLAYRYRIKSLTELLNSQARAFRGMLRYKATAHGASYEEVNESFSTRVCSFCDCKTGPKGVADLGIRSWVCAVCGVSHDRDVNSARNIYFRSGHRTPDEGIPATQGEEDANRVDLSIPPRHNRRYSISQC